MNIEIVEIIAEVGDFDLHIGNVYEVIQEHENGDVEVVLSSGHQATVFHGEYKVIEE